MFCRIKIRFENSEKSSEMSLLLSAFYGKLIVLIDIGYKAVSLSFNT